MNKAKSIFIIGLAATFIISAPIPAKAASTEGVFGNFTSDSELSGFSNLEKDIYNYLKKRIIAVANGTAKTENVETIYGTVRGISTSFTMTNKNVAALRTLAATGDTYAIRRDISNINLSKIVEALMNNCPYELYWFNRQTNIAYDLSGTLDKPILQYTVKFGVGSDFAVQMSGQYYNDGYFDPASVDIADRAIRNAKKIVSANAGKSDYAKLLAYKQAICDMNTYNTAAAASAYETTLINPWEFTSVLDGDASTNGVCEAYSKAFKLLCDLSDFSSPNIKAYLVSGTMSGESSGSVDHMWNIITMENGENYLVDITNCDDGAIGTPDKLFPGTSENVPTGSPYNGYRVTVEQAGYYPTWVGYTYSSSTFASVPASVLTLSTTAYDPNQSGTYSGTSTKLSLSESSAGADEDLTASSGTGDSKGSTNTNNSSGDSTGSSGTGTSSGDTTTSSTTTTTSSSDTATNTKTPSTTTSGSSAITAKQINGVKLSSTKGTVRRGRTKKITFSSKADKSVIKRVTYKSLNTKIAKVSSKGTITGVKKGKARVRVTVTLTNGAKRVMYYTITVKQTPGGERNEGIYKLYI